MAHIAPLELIETPTFTRQVTEAWSAEEYRVFQLFLMLQPEAGSVMPGSLGLRKLRWRLPGRGKRGGIRVVYYLKSEAGQVFLLYLYAKNVGRALNRKELRALRKLVDR